MIFIKKSYLYNLQKYINIKAIFSKSVTIGNYSMFDRSHICVPPHLLWRRLQIKCPLCSHVSKLQKNFTGHQFVPHLFQCLISLTSPSPRKHTHTSVTHSCETQTSDINHQHVIKSKSTSTVLPKHKQSIPIMKI